jgi:hypothetical protein
LLLNFCQQQINTYVITNIFGEKQMATVKKYNLAGVSANVELGKQGSYIAGNANAIGFYTSGDALQKIAIANATVSDQAITKGQLDAATEGLVQHITLDVDYDGASGNLATIAEGSRVLSVTVDVPSAWTNAVNTTSYIEIGDSANGSRFIRSGDIDVSKVAQYHSQFQYEYTSEGVLQYDITTGNATAGTATISIVLASDSVSVTDYGSINTSQNSNNDLGNIS